MVFILQNSELILFLLQTLLPGGQQLAGRYIRYVVCGKQSAGHLPIGYVIGNRISDILIASLDIHYQNLPDTSKK